MNLLTDLLQHPLVQGFILLIIADIYTSIKIWGNSLDNMLSNNLYHNSNTFASKDNLMEQKILDKLHDSGKTDFMIFRNYFPFTPNFRIAYNNLKTLKLIEENRYSDITFINVSDDGAEAAFKGLDVWVKNKVYGDVKRGEFILTKQTTRLEVNALKELENAGDIKEYQKRKYKIVFNQSRNKKPKAKRFVGGKVVKIHEPKFETRLKNFFNNNYVSGIIIGVIGGLIILIISKILLN